MSKIHGGMTLNERLVELQLLGEWDRAATSRDRDMMINVMTKIELSEREAATTVDAVLANPKMYGF
jgi:hypothetical protein